MSEIDGVERKRATRPAGVTEPLEEVGAVKPAAALDRPESATTKGGVTASVPDKFEEALREA